MRACYPCRVLSFVVWLYALAGAEPAAAAAPPAAERVRFIYSRDAGAEHCPDERVVQERIVALLGYDPFAVDAGQAPARRTVTAVITRTGATLSARVEAREADGRYAGERLISSERNDCVELAAVLELAVAIAIDPVRVRDPAIAAVVPADPEPDPGAAIAPLPAAAPSSAEGRPVTEAVVAPTSTPDSKPPAAPPSSSSSSQRAGGELRVGLGAFGALGAAPGPAVGGGARAQFRRGWLGMGIEGRADLPASTAADAGAGGGGGAVRSSLVLGSLLPCAYAGPVGSCLVLAVGALRGQGRDLPDARTATTPFAAAGGRIGIDISLGRSWWFAAALDVLVPMTPTALRVGGSEVWRTPATSGALGLFFGRRFFVTDSPP